MKQYVIDELRFHDFEKVRDYVNRYCRPGGIEGVYWLSVPEEILTDVQQGHDACKPYQIGLELYEDRLCCGLLVRASSNIRCHCIAYANKAQRDWIIETLDAMMEKIGVIV